MIYIDGDGPLQDFARWMVDNDIPLGYDQLETEDRFHEKIDEIFLGSPDAKYLSYFKRLYDLFPPGEVKVLTAVGDHWPCPEWKDMAIDNKILAICNLGFREGDIIVVDSGRDKIKYATQGSNPNVLYDDKWSTVVKWEEAGGLGMFVPECHLRFEEAGHAPKA